jgi:hypothetical protein
MSITSGESFGFSSCMCELKKQDVIPIKSDGGSSSYYDLQLSDKVVEFIKENGYVKTEQLIRDVFGNDFDFANAFKSLVRAYKTTKGVGKEGNDIKYELNKIRYSCNKIEEEYCLTEMPKEIER